jgi:hypothetical protein|tara:strand:- start:497 stop:934 length:438 start_codon:yes stop_codon:yes gene_type:complete
MKIINKIFAICIMLQSPTIIEAKPKFSDRQVAIMIPKYFARDHNAPLITRTRVYAEAGKKILHLNIDVNRNRFENQMEYALSAMASISQYASRPFDTFVLIMEPNSRQFETERIEAKAKCTIDYFVFERVKKDKWSEKCISIEKI